MRIERTPHFWLALCLTLCLTLYLAARTAPQQAMAATAPPATVIWVYDGDTVRLDSGQSLRLAGIDSPELGKKGQPDQFYARQSLKLAVRLARGRQVILRAVGTNRQDRYGRLVAEVILPGGTSLNETLVAEGAAWVYWHNDLHGDYLDRLLAAQRAALEQERGMWGPLLRSAAASAAYVGNSRSYRFFPTHSAEARNIHHANLVRFASLRDAFWQGYAPGRLRDPGNPDAPPRASFLPDSPR